jgi:putative ABC transport system permease protein
MFADLRHAVRSLSRSPGYSLLVVATLTLGLGANTAFFGVLNGILLRPLAYGEPERIMTLWETNPQQGLTQDQVAGGTYQDWRRGSRTFTDMAAYSYGGRVLGAGDEPVRVASVAVTPSLFGVLGVAPMIGSPFDEEQAAASDGRQVLLSYGLWQQRYGADEGVLGTAVSLDGEPYEVVGVMAPGFEFPPDDDAVALWTPLIINPRTAQVRAMRTLSVVGKLAPESGLDEARDELVALTAEIARQFPDSNRGWGVDITPAREQLVGDMRPLLAALVGAAAFVLLIACANIASLQLARSTERQAEFAVRAALGASRWRLIRRSVLESLVLAATGGVCGLIAAYWGVAILRSIIPADVPRVREVGIDPAVVTFTALTAIGAGLVFGAVPALRAMRVRLSAVLQEDSRGASGDRRSRRLLDGLVAAEVCLALVLFVGAGLMVRSFARITAVDPGFRTDNVLSVSLSLPRSQYDAPRMQGFFAELLEDIGSRPGVRAVGATSALPMSAVGNDFDLPFQIEGEDELPQAERPRSQYRSVTPGYFEALGIPLVRGRLIEASDWAENVPVMVVNETMARLYFPGEDPIGEFLGVPMAGRIEIVGIVGDARHASLQSDVQPEMYVSYQQFSISDMTLVVHADSDPASLSALVRDRIREIDPALPLTQVATMDELISESLAQPRFNMILLMGLAASALLLAAVGIYGVVSYSVVQRSGEIGVRMALGADARGTRRLVIREAMTVAAVGVGAGLVATIGVGRLVSGLLYGVGPNDPLTLLVGAVVLVGIAALAAAVPAARATRIDPAAALRSD